MIVVQNTAQFILEKSISQNIPDHTLFFDIETTGFSAKTSHLYMIGAAYVENQIVQTIQWLDDSGTANGELEILKAFSEFSSEFENCISFNGSTFDFVYIENKCREYNLENPLLCLNHRDLYKELKPYKSALNLPDLKQKTVEKFLGIRRRDKYTGGELIKVYRRYLSDPSEALREMLLCHNFEDLCGMIQLLSLDAYISFFRSDYEISKIDFEENRMTVSLGLKFFILIPTDIHTDYFDIHISACDGKIEIPCFIGELKFFFPNYKDYFYLPVEDEAVHKSLGIYVDPKRRVRATRENCYTKKTGQFLFQPEEWFSPAFKESALSKKIYFSAASIMNDQKAADQYVRNLFHFVFH